MVSPGKDAQRPTPTCDGIVAFMRGFSIEALPRETERMTEFAVLPPRTNVYLTRLPKADFGETVRAARRVREAGFRPVPHVTARTIRDVAELRADLGALALAGVDEILLVAGSQETHAGAFADTLQVLASGEIERAGIARVGVAGHPEGHPTAEEATLDAALAEKNAFARRTGLELYLVTQFFFDETPVIEWERRVRALGNRLPVHVGFHGITGTAGLLKHAIACGIGDSMKVLAKHTNLLQLAMVRTPDRLVSEIVRAISTDAGSLFAHAHFFPLGGFARTANWATAVAANRFTLEPDGSLKISP
jgi:methylenetetrahydrofolate reductase (NADPH)